MPVGLFGLGWSSISPVKNGGKNGENGENFISGHDERNSFERAPFFYVSLVPTPTAKTDTYRQQDEY